MEPRRVAHERSTTIRRLLVDRRRTLLLRAGILAVGWWALREGDLAGAGFGGVVVLLSLAAGVALTSAGSPTWRPGGLLLLAFHFVVGSIRGGLDVARRAFAREPALSPAMIAYPLRLPAGSGRHLFAGALSLMPGTLSVRFDDRGLELHVLVDHPHVLQPLERLEAAIARALGEPLQAPHA